MAGGYFVNDATKDGNRRNQFADFEILREQEARQPIVEAAPRLPDASEINQEIASVQRAQIAAVGREVEELRRRHIEEIASWGEAA